MKQHQASLLCNYWLKLAVKLFDWVLIMSNGFIEVMERMLASHEKHLKDLLKLKDAGGSMTSWPEGETLDDFINREDAAVKRFTRTIEKMKSRS